MARSLSEPYPEDLNAVVVRYGVSIQRGIGTYAKKNIKLGTRIIRDRPILRFGAYMDPYEVFTQFLGLNEQSRKAILTLSSRKSQRDYYFGRINDHDLDTVFSLCGRKYGGGVITKEQAANVLAIFDDNQPQLQYQSRPELALQIARINHSCIPNVCVAWNSRLGMYTVHAIRDIAKDEEILYSYVYLPEPREHRQEQLQRWDINCTCWACTFDDVSMEEQKQKLIAKDAQDVEEGKGKSRPKIKRRSTGELNTMWYKQPTPQSSENRRWQWKWRNESMNKTNKDKEILGRVSTYEAMIGFLGPENMMLEERIRLYKEIIREREEGDDERDRDPVKAAVAYGDALEFARICYGDDGDITTALWAEIRKNEAVKTGVIVSKAASGGKNTLFSDILNRAL